jgi:hypothetical protein
MAISPGKIVVEPSPVSRRLGMKAITHTNNEVKLVRTRLCPPWIGVHLSLWEGSTQALAGGSIWLRKPWRSVLSQAGFTVIEVKTWISRYPPR